jgi:hypothetical protein
VDELYRPGHIAEIEGLRAGKPPMKTPIEECVGKSQQIDSIGSTFRTWQIP